MGGPGSGSWYRSSRSTVEGSRSIDVRDWKRDGLLNSGNRFRSYWTRDGEETGSIQVRIAEDQAILSYRSRSYGDAEWENVEQSIPISWSECHFGGTRPWFICGVHANGVYCGRRVAKLYGAGKLFACRHCYNLAFQSQQEPAYGRALLKSQRIRVKLGGSAASVDPFPDKPKGMHWSTYWRLREEAEDAEHASWMGAAERFGIAL